MPLRLIPADGHHAETLERLHQLYLHDLAEFEAVEPNESGLFCRPLEPGLTTFLVVLRDRPAGFVCLGAEREATVLSHLFIVRSYRRLGIGEEIARRVFDNQPGPWKVSVGVENEPAAKFLRKVLLRYTLRRYRELGTSAGDKRVFEFNSGD